jgi:hypothetical protein
MRWFSRWYGANPLHLLTLIASFALAGYAAQRLLARDPMAILIWFAGAVIGHDLLLMPLYTLADRSVLAVFRHDRRPDPPTVSWINYLRVPVVLSGLLLLIWFPLIFRLATRHERACERISKHSASANADSERQRGGRHERRGDELTWRTEDTSMAGLRASSPVRAARTTGP